MYVQWEFRIWLLHEILQVMPVDRDVKDFPSRFSKKNKFFASEDVIVKGPH
jgi:hypothetical protein